MSQPLFQYVFLVSLIKFQSIRVFVQLLIISSFSCPFVPFHISENSCKKVNRFYPLRKLFILSRQSLVILGFIILNLCKCYIWSCSVQCKKIESKKNKKKESCNKKCVEKVAKERRRIRLLVCTSAEFFISSCTTSLLSLLV